ncbi:MAG: methyltransferase [Terriglobia bacterium]|jgi:protein-S-isoprenylcysteine O-methyltransferase Ste14
MKTLFLTVRSIVYMTGFLLFFGWIALSVRVLDPHIGISLPAGVKTPGIIMAALGAILVLVCAGVFIIRGRGTPAIFDAPRAFVAVGPYRYVRNPMYIGGLILLLGLALYLDSLAILLLALLLSCFVHLFVLFYEEPTLVRQFGKSYEEYLRSVRRWIPRWPAE